MSTPQTETRPAGSPWPEVDAECVRAVLAGQRERFAELVERYQLIVASIVRGYIRDTHRAEDACQDIFVKAFSALGTLRDPRLFQSWLAQIARHRAGQMARHQQSRPDRHALGDAEILEAPASDSVKDPSTVFAKVEELPEPYRQTVLLKYTQNLSCKQIAEMEGVAVGTITSRLTRALMVLRTGLASKFPQ